MVHPTKNILVKPSEQNLIKSSSPVCKCLFDFPDSNETKRMVRDMVNSEHRRLRDLWDFDARINFPAGLKDSDSGRSDSEAPMPQQRRYDWELQERQNVPDYYSRPIHRHYSEYRNLQRSPVKTPSSRLMVKLVYCQQRSSPQPLSCRDANVSLKIPCEKQSLPKDFPDLTSPPRLSPGNLKPFDARRVTALRVPLPTMPRKSETFKESEAALVPVAQNIENVNVEVAKETNDAPPRSVKSPESKSLVIADTSSAKRPAPRQLFTLTETRKRRRVDEGSSKQRKMTDWMLPIRNLRSNAPTKPQEGKLHAPECGFNK